MALREAINFRWLLLKSFGLYFPGRLWLEVVLVVRGQQDHLGDDDGVRGRAPDHVHRDRHVHSLQGQEDEQAQVSKKSANIDYFVASKLVMRKQQKREMLV